VIQLRSKLRYIYRPFILTAVGFLVIYTFLNWLLFIQLDILPLRRNLTDILFPIVLAWIPLLIWIRPRLKWLVMREKYVWLYLIYGWVAILIPTALAQPYIEQITGELTPLDNISRINAVRETKYYTLRDYYISKHNGVAQEAFDISGKYGENFNMRLYVVFPIWLSATDTAGNSPQAWLGLEYKNTVNRHLSDAEKDAQFRQFQAKTVADVDSKNLNQFTFLERPESRTDASDGFQEAIKQSTRYNPAHTTVLMPHAEPFGERTGNRLMWVFLSFLIGAGVWFVILLVPNFSKPNNIDQDSF